MERFEIDNQVIYHGHVLDVLPTLPERSVHAVVTSPPYFGLRAYKTMPQIWGGDPNCKHEFGPKGKKHRGGPAGDDGRDRAGRNGTTDIATGQFCPNCQCWRGELGSEPHPGLFVSHLVMVFDAVRRVLRDDGLLWVNIGDSFNAQMGQRKITDKAGPKQQTNTGSPMAPSRHVDGLKPLDKLGIPERFVLAMQAAGWYWRQTIVWDKPSCMPESVNGTRWEKHRIKVKDAPRDGKSNYAGAYEGVDHPRPNHNGYAIELAKWSDCPGCDKCHPHGGYVLRRGSWRATTSHEYIYQFAKTANYWANAEAVKEPHGFNRWSDWRLVNAGVLNDVYDDDAGDSSVLRSGVINCFPAGGKNPRSVWRIGAEPLHGPHYAAFPSELAARCIRPSVPDRCCAKCGAGYAPVVDRKLVVDGDPVRLVGPRRDDNGRFQKGIGHDRFQLLSRVLDYWPTCTCCQTCDTMGLIPERRRLVHVQEHQSQEGIRSEVLPEEVPGESRIPGLGRTEKTEISKTMCPVQCKVQGSNQDSEILLSDLFHEMDVENGTRESDASERQERIQKCDEERKDNQRTSGSHAGSPGEEALTDGTCPPHQWRQKRQSTGKSGCVAATGSRQEAHEASQHIIVAYDPVPGTVLDPFLGSGTTLLVAKKLALRGVGIELNPEYVQLSLQRIRNSDGETRPTDLTGQATFQFQE